MFKYLRALLYFFTGRINKARQALQENEYVMAATYDKAIDDAQKQLKNTKDAVENLIMIETEMQEYIKGIQSKLDRCNSIISGAMFQAQNRLNELKAQGKTREEIESDPEFKKHQSAYSEAEEKAAEYQADIDARTKDLIDRQNTIEHYKDNLKLVRSTAEKLRQEKEESLADLALAKQTEALQSQIGDISSGNFNESLAEARRIRNKSKSRFKVAQESLNSGVGSLEKDYIQYANSAKATETFSKSLDWGDSEKETSNRENHLKAQNAILPES